MLTKVEVANTQGQTLILPLEDISDGFVVKEITGLDPVKATISSSAFAQLDGATFQGARREIRNMLMKIGIEPDYETTSVQELRQELYAFFMPKTDVTARFFLDDVLFAIIDGKVESCEAAPFAKEPELVASILCFDPNFSSPDSIVFEGNTVADDTEVVIDYGGTVETGFVFRLLLDRAESAFTIYNRRPDGTTLSLDFNLSMLTDDVVEISTLSRRKAATLTRAAIDTSVLYAVSPLSKWMPLFPGVNNFRVLASGDPIPYEVEYTPKYGGL